MENRAQGTRKPLKQKPKLRAKITPKSESREWEIDPDAREFVKERSQGTCEMCGEYPAVHMHHLTYKRAGREWPDDLRHICLICHMALHPEKARDLADFELTRSDDAACIAEDVLYSDYQNRLFELRDRAFERQREEWFENQRNYRTPD